MIPQDTHRYHIIGIGLKLGKYSNSDIWSYQIQKDNVVGRSYDVIQIDQKTGKPVPSFCMFGGRDAAIYTYQVLKIGQTMYLCHQWYNELWKPVHNEWGISSVIIKHDSFQDRAIMFFLDKEKNHMSYHAELPQPCMRKKIKRLY